MLGLEKWQKTPAGSEAQPRPMVSVNVPLELRLTVTVAFWEVAILTLEGLTANVNCVGVPETVIAGEEDGRWSTSPL
jgi:hypothetical protein